MNLGNQHKMYERNQFMFNLIRAYFAIDHPLMLTANELTGSISLFAHSNATSYNLSVVIGITSGSIQSKLWRISSIKVGII